MRWLFSERQNERGVRPDRGWPSARAQCSFRPLMATKSNPMHFDKRVVERFIRAGVVKREDYDKHLAALADVEAQSELINASLADDDDDLDGADDLDEDEG